MLSLAVVAVVALLGSSTTPASAAIAFTGSPLDFTRPALDRDARLGSAVAVSGDLVVAGGTGIVYAFVPDAEGRRVAVPIVPDDREPGPSYGESVAVADGTVVVGESRAGEGGAVYVFTATDDRAGFRQSAVLSPNDLESGDDFGRAVAIVGQTIVVGAPRADHGGVDAGAAYVFDPDDRRPSGYVQTEKLRPVNPVAEQAFGASVAYDGARIAVGAPGHDGGPSTSRAHVFSLDPDSVGDFVQRAVVEVNGRGFGHAVAIGGDSLLVAALYERDRRTDAFRYLQTDTGYELQGRERHRRTDRPPFVSVATRAGAHATGSVGEDDPYDDDLEGYEGFGHPARSGSVAPGSSRAGSRTTSEPRSPSRTSFWSSAPRPRWEGAPSTSTTASGRTPRC